MRLFGWCLKKQEKIHDQKVVKYCFKISCKHLKLLGEQDEREYLSVGIGHDFQRHCLDSITNKIMRKHRGGGKNN